MAVIFIGTLLGDLRVYHGVLEYWSVGVLDLVDLEQFL